MTDREVQGFLFNKLKKYFLMKRKNSFFLLISLFVLFSAIQVMAEERPSKLAEEIHPSATAVISYDINNDVLGHAKTGESIDDNLAYQETIQFNRIKYTKKNYQNFGDNIYVATNEQVEDILKMVTEESMWYGLYLIGSETDNSKVGYVYYKERIYESETFDCKIYELQASFNFVSNNLGEELKLTMVMETIYEAVPPYRFFGEKKILTEAGIVEKEISTRENNKLITIFDNGKDETKKILENFNYTLNHYFASIAWYHIKTRKIGDSMKYIELDTTEHRYDETTSEIIDSSVSLVDGVKYQYFTVRDTYLDVQGNLFKIESIVDQEGNLLKFILPDFQLEARLEKEEVAKDLNNIVDLFVENIIYTDRPYPEFTDTPIDILFEIKGDYKDEFASTYGQEVFEKDGRKFLRLGYEVGKRNKATREEIEKNLKAGDLYPINDPEIIKMAINAVAGSKDDWERVEKLRIFVSNYVEYSYEISGVTTVYDILKNPKGDCTEHAFLFTALAKSIGLPTREIGGYAYMPDIAGFGGHAWNEVVIDGYWQGVDATWNIWLPSLTHITADHEKDTSLKKNFMLKLLSITYEDGRVERL